jgi:UDP-hydrolysing UDP-N-acetyl-D-glucosamine 2-epimerase
LTPSARAIGVVTVSRSDYGHLVPVLREISAAPDLRLLLFVAGAHLSPRFGRTVGLVEADGWPITASIDLLEADDSPAGIAASMARGVDGFARAFTRQRPEVLVLLGDRFEMLAAAVAALPLVLPVAHVHGGEESEGAIDNQMRHAITKLSHVHFASAEPHARRIARMGEEPWRIHVTGAPGLDRIRPSELMSRAEVAASLGLPQVGPWLVVTFHPVTLEYGATERHVDELLAALDKLEAALVLTYPGADTAGRTIIDRIEEFAGHHPNVRLGTSLGDRLYLSLLEHADAMVGNSSSGLIEAPSFGLPAVNIGSRQAGRLRGANVIDVEPERDDILRGIDSALTPGLRARLRAMANPYGDGRASSRIVEVLRQLELTPRLVRKRFVETEGRS